MTQPTSRRTACDRCKAQKLRCTQPEERGSGRCSRCSRVGADCVTSDAKPTGRPRKARGDPISGVRWVSDEVAEPSPVPVSGALPADWAPDLEINGAAMAWMDSNLPGVSPAGDQGPWPTFEQLQYSTMDLDLPNLEGFLGGNETDFRADPELGVNGVLPIYSNADEILVALSRLSEDISQQLSRSKAFQREPNVSTGETGAPPRVPNMNGVAVALKCTSDFTKILQALLSPNSSEPRELDNAPPSSVNAPTALLVLSCYLQLTHLYDTIFKFLCRAFREHPDSIGRCPSSVDSQFRVAGVSAIDGPLYVKLLVQVIEHHIEGTEKLLGLPREAVVSGREPDPGGIFSNDDLQRVAQFIMAREDTPGDSAESRIVSLRDAIQEAKDLL